MLGTAYNEHWSTLYSVLLTKLVCVALQFTMLQLDAQIHRPHILLCTRTVRQMVVCCKGQYILVLDSLQLRGVCPSNMSMAWWRACDLPGFFGVDLIELGL